MDMITQLQQEWIKLHEDHANTYKKIDLAREMQNKRKNRNITHVQYRPGDWVSYPVRNRLAKTNCSRSGLDPSGLRKSLLAMCIRWKISWVRSEKFMRRDYGSKILVISYQGST